MKRFNPISLKNLDQTKHGMCNTPTWKSWQTMIRRCRGGNDKAKWYADRGIKVCERWKTFENFYADMGERPAGMSLDRIDNNGGYEPGNCRWATRVEQGGNKRNNVIWELNGKRQCAARWAKELGINRTTLQKRLKAGWPMEKVLSSRFFHEQKGRRSG